MRNIDEAERAKLRDAICRAMIDTFPHSRGNVMIDVDLACAVLIECLGAMLASKDCTRTRAGRKAEFAAVLNDLAEIVGHRHAAEDNVVQFPGHA